MMLKIYVLLLLVTLNPILSMDPEIEEEELRASYYLIYLNKWIPEIRTKMAIASWNHESNITEETLKTKVFIKIIQMMRSKVKNFLQFKRRVLNIFLVF